MNLLILFLWFVFSVAIGMSVGAIADEIIRGEFG